MIIKALLEVSIKGVGKLRKTPIFPCGIFKLKKGVNRKDGEPNYDLYKLALKSTAQRLYPNYANEDNSNQISWMAYDRKMKEEYINSLSEEEYNSLALKLKESKELRDILMLDVVE